jgi:hypothetical protein
MDFVNSSLVLVEPDELSRISLQRASVLIEKSKNELQSRIPTESKTPLLPRSSLREDQEV